VKKGVSLYEDHVKRTWLFPQAVGTVETKPEAVKELQTRKDFASRNSGATILKSDSGIRNAASILGKSNDEYLMIPNCGKEVPEHELIIHLAEDVAVEQILADNHEDFSANLQ